MEKIKRCLWAEKNEKMKHYHDNVWGKPVRDDREMFRMLVLEMFQSGLSWNTILQREELFDEEFENFEIEKVGNFSEEKIEKILENGKIIRHRKKIVSSINNAKKVLEIQQKYGSFSKFIWRYVFDTPVINPWSTPEEVPSKNMLSDKICEDLKKEGFQFIGSTTIYSFLQAIGVINDHLTSCDFKYEE
ncbi:MULTISPECIES: DNA-3-methyladenine glycosylase I [Helcococcus]|uniref:DNA-3-methyladenine glycosylase I n=1 Tax=Helcococcus bovis TaxID=3153252 RepID=A0ABW9F4X5_9FIRM